MFASAVADSVRSSTRGFPTAFGGAHKADGASPPTTTTTTTVASPPSKSEVARSGWNAAPKELSAPPKPAAEPNSGGFGTRTGFSGFGSFRSAAASTTPQAAAPEPAKTGFTSFGSFKVASSNDGRASPSSSMVQTTFGTLQVQGPMRIVTAIKDQRQAMSDAHEPATKSAFSGFGTFSKAVTSNDGAASPSSSTIQMSFGTLQVQGPMRTLNAIKDQRQTMSDEHEAKQHHKEEEKREKRRVHFEEPVRHERHEEEEEKPQFEDVEQAKHAAQAEADAVAKARVLEEKRREAEEKAAAEEAERMKKRAAEEEAEKFVKAKMDAAAAAAAAASAEETETDDDAEPERPLPWGKRPSFRKMLAGGNKKLTLLSPPSGVTNYFTDQVFRSYGCCYDDVSSTFYATSPGGKGRNTGQVIAMSGNCQDAPVCVTRDLLEPAAIAVYEPGLSVCTVTNQGIFVFTRQFDQKGIPTGKYLSRQISTKNYHRGIAATQHGGIVSFSNGRIRFFDGTVSNGDERVLAEVNYDSTINNALFLDNPDRRRERSNACFMDIVDGQLVLSDLQKHVVSLWKIEERPAEKIARISFLRAIDVAISPNQIGKPGSLRGPRIPLGKCAFASGIRLDADGWVLCADADGRTIQIYDDNLTFVTRVETPDGLPYISGLCIESGGHLMVCDRKSEMGGLRVYMLEAVDAQQQPQRAPAPAARAPPLPSKEDKKPTYGFAAAARQQQQQQQQQKPSGGGGGRFF